MSPVGPLRYLQVLPGDISGRGMPTVTLSHSHPRPSCCTHLNHTAEKRLRSRMTAAQDQQDTGKGELFGGSSGGAVPLMPDCPAVASLVSGRHGGPAR